MENNRLAMPPTKDEDVDGKKTQLNGNSWQGRTSARNTAIESWGNRFGICINTSTWRGRGGGKDGGKGVDFSVIFDGRSGCTKAQL